MWIKSEPKSPKRRDRAMDARRELKGCHLFGQLDDAGLAPLVAMARVCSYQKGEVIFRQSAEVPGVFLVVEGLVRIYQLAPGGKEHVLELVGPSRTFAEVAAIAGFPCPAYAQAVEPTTCVVLPGEPFRRLLRTDHDLCYRVLTGMAGWVRRLVEQLEDIVLRDAAGRVARYLLGAPERGDRSVQLPGLKKHLASHLDLTSETLSRTLRRLADAGLISSEADGTIRVLDHDGLRQAAI